MFDLTRQEKIILIFLTLTFVTGLGVSAYKNTEELKLEVRPCEMAVLEDADSVIARHTLININSFETDELTRLPGIGEKLAQRIVEYRTLHGPFESKEELMQVEGIGGKKFDKIKDLITLE